MRVWRPAAPEGAGRELRSQLSILKSTFDQLPIPELQPQSDNFASAPNGFVASAIGKPGEVYLVYVHVDLPGRLQDQPVERYTQINRDVRLRVALPDGHYTIKQIDTKSGESSNLAPLNVSGGQAAELTLSPFATDTAVWIELQ